MSDEVDELRIEARLRNNILWHAIFDVYPSVAEFCRIHKLSLAAVRAYLNLSSRPFKRIGAWWGWMPTAKKIAEATGLTPTELFPFGLYEYTGPTRMAREIPMERYLPLSSLTREQRLLPPNQEPEIINHEMSDAVGQMLATLTPREERVIRMRFGFDGYSRTLAEVADELAVTRERIRQIESKAFRKLRHPSRTKRIRSFINATAS